jgi:hypothetical protein
MAYVSSNTAILALINERWRISSMKLSSRKYKDPHPSFFHSLSVGDSVIKWGPFEGNSTKIEVLATNLKAENKKRRKDLGEDLQDIIASKVKKSKPRNPEKP